MNAPAHMPRVRGTLRIGRIASRMRRPTFTPHDRQIDTTRRVLAMRCYTSNRVYPYLLRGVPITRVNHVWSTDIDSIRLHGGFISLVAVMDWFSRYVLSWAVSITMDVGFCLEALEQALQVARPEIFNSDQGAQFSSLDFTGRLASAGIQISMDGRGRALDNVFIERLWRTVKYEEVYLKDYETPREAMQGLGTFFVRYNEWRQHQALGYQTPAAVYFSSYL